MLHVVVGFLGFLTSLLVVLIEGPCFMSLLALLMVVLIAGPCFPLEPNGLHGHGAHPAVPPPAEDIKILLSYTGVLCGCA